AAEPSSGAKARRPQACRGTSCSAPRRSCRRPRARRWDCGRCRRHGWPRPSSVRRDRKSTRLNSSHVEISYAVFCLKKKKNMNKSFAVARLAPHPGAGDLHSAEPQPVHRNLAADLKHPTSSEIKATWLLYLLTGVTG